MLLAASRCLRRGLRCDGAMRRHASGQAASSYAKLTDADFAFFRSILSENDVITDASALEQYNVDWMKKYEGKSKLALRPRTTQQVSQILKHCNERKLPVVPQGGNTGLVGGSVAVNDEVVLSLSGMDKILAFDEFSGTVTCQAGAVLQAVQEKAESFGYTFPLDLGAKGSCQIGGNVATNAGGLRFLRYGSLHGTVLGIEAVLADGTIIDNLNTLKKDNTGYDVKQLFIGSEGTLGVITGVAIALPKLPNSVQLAYLAVDSYAAVLDVFREAKGHLAEILSAVEFLDDQALDLTLTHLHGARNPLEGRAPFYMLIEVSGSNEEHDSAKLTGFLEHVMESGMVTDGTLAADSTQMAGARTPHLHAALPCRSPCRAARGCTWLWPRRWANCRARCCELHNARSRVSRAPRVRHAHRPRVPAGVWRIREGISEALSKAGAVYKYDISLPLPQLYQLVEDMRARLADEQGARARAV